MNRGVSYAVVWVNVTDPLYEPSTSDWKLVWSIVCDCFVKAVELVMTSIDIGVEEVLLVTMDCYRSVDAEYNRHGH